MSIGTTRKLVIFATRKSDEGEVSVKTNGDERRCILKVSIDNQFIKGLEPLMNATEREPFTVNVKVKVISSLFIHA